MMQPCSLACQQPPSEGHGALLLCCPVSEEAAQLSGCLHAQAAVPVHGRPLAAEIWPCWGMLQATCRNPVADGLG